MARKHNSDYVTRRRQELRESPRRGRLGMREGKMNSVAVARRFFNGSEPEYEVILAPEMTRISRAHESLEAAETAARDYNKAHRLKGPANAP